MNALVGKIPVEQNGARYPVIFESDVKPCDPTLVGHIGCVPQDDVMLGDLTVKRVSTLPGVPAMLSQRSCRCT